MANFLSWKSKSLHWTFERHRAPIFSSDIRDAQYFLGISLKNKRFSNDWIAEVLDGVGHLSGSAVIALVDTPYISTEETLSSGKMDLVRRLEVLQRQSEENRERLQRLIRPYSSFVTMVSWSDLEKLKSLEIVIELNSAFKKSTRVRSLVLAQVQKVFSSSLAATEIEHLAKFFIEEIPTLISIYYSAFDGIIDLYPGPQADFFWELDSGALQSDLPMATALALSRCPHTYGSIIQK